MKSFKQILETVYRPKGGDEQAFLDKHVVDLQAHPVANEFQFKAAKTPKAKRKADYDEKEDEKVYEAAEVHTKRADKEPVIVRSTDPKTGESKAKTVMRRAGEIKIGEEVELEESITKLSDARLKFHATKDVPHGSYTRKEIKDEHERRKKTGGAEYASVKPSMNEEADLDEKVKNPYAVGMAAAMKATGDTPPLKKSTIVKGHEIAKSIKKEAMDPVGKADADINNDGKVDGSDKYLHARRKAIGKALRKEETEELDEISKKTLGSYVTKASYDAAKHAARYGSGSNPGSFVKAHQRLAGIKKASDKLAKEEVEQIDEISTNLARSYIRKAATDNADRKEKVMKPFPLKDMEKNVAMHQKFKKRQAGIETAGKKVYGIGGKAKVSTTEEVELDEAFKVGSMKLNDGSSVTITKESAEVLNSLFNQLNGANKSKMEERMMSGQKGFKEILSFAENI